MDKYTELKELLKQYGKNLMSNMSFYYGDDIPEKKLNNAIESYASSVEKSKVYALLDGTILGSAKEGMLFTNAGIYIKEVFKNAKFIPYSSLKKTIVSSNDTNESEKTLVLVTEQGKQIDITTPFYNKNILKKMFDAIIFLKDSDKAVKANSISSIEEMNDILKESYLKIIVAFMNLYNNLDDKKLSELYLLMKQIKTSMLTRKQVLISLSISNTNIDDLLSSLDNNLSNEDKILVHLSLLKDILRISTACNTELSVSQNNFISNILNIFNINDNQIKFLYEAIDIDQKFLLKDFKNCDILDTIKSLGIKGEALGVPIKAFYLSGSVSGIKNSSIVSGLVALGLSGHLGLNNSNLTGIDFALSIGVNAYRGLKRFAGLGESNTERQREYLIEEALKNIDETILDVISDIHFLSSKIVDLLRNVELNSVRIKKFSTELDMHNNILKLLQYKSANLKSLL